MGAGAMHGQSHNTNDTQQVPSTRKVNNMSCEVCAVHFNLFKRKKTCSECGKLHCANCLSKGAASAGGRHRCRLCWFLVSDSLSRSDLMAYGVSDLRRFLVKRHIATDKCTEKRDLVELIMQLRSGQGNHRQQQLEHEQHLLRLQENVRASEHVARSPTSHTQQPQQSAADVIIIEDLEEQVGQETGTCSVVSQPADAAAAAAAAEVERQESDSASSCSDARPVDKNNSVPQPPTAEQPAQEVPKKSDTSRLASLDGDNIESLTIRQLKEILVKNFVNYKGCCEKWELVDRVRRLWEANKQNQQQAEQIANDATAGTSSSGTNDMCKVCMDAVIDCVLLDCGHMVTCTNCGKRMAECPICRQYVVRVVHTFKA